jgi:hypothetical protein
MSKEFTHFDKLGKLITLGDYVAFPQSNILTIGTVIKLNLKMVKIRKVNHKPSTYNTGEYNRYSNDLVILNGPDVTAYLLKL